MKLNRLNKFLNSKRKDNVKTQQINRSGICEHGRNGR